jgi:hypothetical protein
MQISSMAVLTLLKEVFASGLSIVTGGGGVTTPPPGEQVTVSEEIDPGVLHLLLISESIHGEEILSSSSVETFVVMVFWLRGKG